MKTIENKALEGICIKDLTIPVLEILKRMKKTVKHIVISILTS
jgi:hypothetical protein